MAARQKRQKKPHEFVWVVPLRRVFPWWYLAGLVLTLGVITLFGSVTAGSAGALWGPVIALEIKDRQERAAKRMKEGLPVQRRDLSDIWRFEVGTTLIFTAICAGIAVSIGALFDGVVVGRLVAGLLLLAGGGLGLVVVLLRARSLRSAKRSEGSNERVSQGEHDHAENDGDVPRGIALNQFNDAESEIEGADHGGPDRQDSN